MPELCPSCNGTGFVNFMKEGESLCKKCQGTGYLKEENHGNR
jgi:DnaJ-class molecular chaperone